VTNEVVKAIGWTEVLREVVAKHILVYVEKRPDSAAKRTLAKMRWELTKYLVHLVLHSFEAAIEAGYEHTAGLLEEAWKPQRFE